jgi:NAD+ synthase (glutamine-hydrolysing)
VQGIVIGTGDLSELALGWCTYNADHMSMYGVNCGVPKTLVRYLVSWCAQSAYCGATQAVLNDICATPVSPELLPPDAAGEISQVTEDHVGPYELHDFFLFQVVRHQFAPKKVLFLAQQTFHGVYADATILRWLRVFYRRFFAQQFKRSCLPDGPKVGSVALSPRGDWRMPSDASVDLWINELETVEQDNA